MGELLEAAEVAAMLGMTKAWVYEQTRKDAIPYIRLGRFVRFRRQSIEDWIRNRERGKIPST
jgi:excisionase family DNA binding protein